MKKTVIVKHHTPAFGKVAAFSLPFGTIAAAIPPILSLAAFVLACAKAEGAAAGLFQYGVLPLAFLCPLAVIFRTGYIFRRSFPRKDHGDEGAVLGAILLCAALSLLFCLLFFFTGCMLLSLKPTVFYDAALITEYALSAPQAMWIAGTTVFLFFSVFTMLVLTSSAIGRSAKKFSFSIECALTAGFYFLILIFTLLIFFGATFLDITALENVQIRETVLSSNLLCLYLSFDLVALIFIPLLSLLLYKKCKTIPKPTAK